MVSFGQISIKERGAQRFSANFAHPPSCESALNFTNGDTHALFISASLLVFIDWQFGTRLATATVATLLLHLAKIGIVARNKF